jgi:hypothetical protein
MTVDLFADRHDHDWPHRRIALGSGVYSDAHVRSLLAVGITHVLDCRGWPGDAYGDKVFAGTGIAYCHNATPDDGHAKEWEWFLRSVQFARQALADPRAKLLVHCSAGVNRSPATVYAIMRAVLGMPAGKAWAAIEGARRVAKPRYVPDADRAVQRGL